MLTSTVPVNGGHYHQLPVITSAPIPKEKIFDVMDEIHKAHVNAPVHVGDVIIENVAGTGINILASRSMN